MYWSSHIKNHRLPPYPSESRIKMSIFILDLKIILASNVGKKEIFHSVNCSDQPEIPQAIESHGVKPECSFWSFLQWVINPSACFY